MASREAFLQAKIEYYLQQAEECFHMARLVAARKTLCAVAQLDAQNASYLALSQSIDSTLVGLAHRANGHESPAVPTARRVPELVLLVDQDERLLFSLATDLRRHGFDTVSAATYDEAVETLNAVSPDAIVCEVNFETGPRGFDLYLQLKTDERRAGAPFVFLTARLDREMLIAGKRFGVDDFLLKPVDADVVAASIRSSLLRRRKEVPLEERRLS